MGTQVLARKVDSEGYFVEDVILNTEEGIPENVILDKPTVPFFKPKWDGEKWCEGATVEEIQQIQSKQSDPPIAIDEINMRIESAEFAIIGLMDRI